MFGSHETDEGQAARRPLWRIAVPALVLLGCVAGIGVARRAGLRVSGGVVEMEEEPIGRVVVSVERASDGGDADSESESGGGAVTGESGGPSVVGDDFGGAAVGVTDESTDDDDESCDSTAWAGEDYQYMLANEYDEEDAVTASSKLRRWHAEFGSTYTACNVSVSRLDLLEPAGTSVPSSDAHEWFSFSSDAYLVVGNVSVRLDALTAEGARSYACASDASAGGCMYWIGAETRLRVTANSTAGVAVLTAGAANLTTHRDTRTSDGSAIVVDDLSCGPLYTVSGSCSGMAVNGECGGGLFDNLDADISPPFPQHYHPRGAFYYVVSGSMSFNDTGREGLYIDAGDMRFVNAAVYYGPEAGNSSTVFLSLHEPDPAAYGSWYRSGQQESGASACDFVCTSVPGDDPLTCTQGW